MTFDPTAEREVATGEGSAAGEEAIFTCKEHGAYAAKWLPPLPLSGRTRPVQPKCPECDAKLREGSAKSEKQERVDRMNALFAAAGVPQRFMSASFGGYQCRDSHKGQKAILDVLRAYCEKGCMAGNVESGRSLILCGSPGTGKTHLGVAMVRAAIVQEISAHYIAFPDLITEIRDAYSDRSRSEKSIIDKYGKSAKFLVLDEVGTESGDHARNKLFQIMNLRYSWQLPTVMITNMGVNALSKYVGARIMDRLKDGGGQAFAFDWPSHRGK